MNGQSRKDRYAGSKRRERGWKEKDRTQEGKAEKRSVASGVKQGREWVGLNLCVSPGFEGVGLSS